MFYCFSTILMVHLVIFNVIIQACEHLRFIEVKLLKIQNHSPFHTSQLWFGLLKYFGFSSEITAYGREILQSNGTWEKRDTPGCMFCIHWDFAGLSLSRLAPMIWGLWSFFYGLAKTWNFSLYSLSLRAPQLNSEPCLSQAGPLMLVVVWKLNDCWHIKVLIFLISVQQLLPSLSLLLNFMSSPLAFNIIFSLISFPFLFSWSSPFFS